MRQPLNDEQAAAARALAGGVLIGAGAGSGKTRTLVERFALATEDVPEDGWHAAGVDEVLAITFTDKAAGEIAERVRAMLRQQGRREAASRVDGAWVSTIHGLCSRLLRRYALEAGIDPNFTVADAVEVERLREQAFEAAARVEVQTEEGRALFESLGFAVVFKAVTGAAANSVVLRLGTSALKPSRAIRPSEEILADARALFDTAGAEVAACGSTSKVAVQVQEHCRQTGEELGAICASSIGEALLAAELQQALATYKPHRTAVKAIAEVREALEARHRSLCADVAEALGAAQAQVIVRLVLRFAREFSSRKRARGVLDFDDLQVELRQLLVERPDVRDRCRGLFRLSMVDEFQDTDALQAAVIEQLAGDDLCTVGDERQAIYGFRGADVNVFRKHVRAMVARGARPFELRTNYRSHPDVLTFINTLFGSDLLFGGELIALAPGRIEPDPPVVPPVRPRIEIAVGDLGGCNRGDSREGEARWVASRLAQLRDEHGLSAGEMAVLVRGYTHAEVYARALRAEGFEAAVVGGNRLFELPETAMARSLLRVVANPHDETALVDVLAGDAGRVSDDGIWKLAHARVGQGSHAGIWEALAAPPSTIAKSDDVRVRAVYEAVSAARRRVGDCSLAELLLTLIEELDVDLLLLARGAEGRQSFANVLQLARMIRSLEGQGVTGPAAVEAHLAAMRDFGVRAMPAVVADAGSQAIRIMSVHAAKGLEFPVVAAVELDGYVKGGASSPVRVGALPGEEHVTLAVKPAPEMAAVIGEMGTYARLASADAHAEDEEAKRLFYVACTRAREVLLLVGGASLDKPVKDGDPQPMTFLRRATEHLWAAAKSEGGTIDVGGVAVGVEVLVPPGDDSGPAEAVMVSPASASSVARDAGDVGVPVSVREEPESDRTGPATPVRLSFSDFELYRRCGLRFHAERIARVGSLRGLERGSAAGFGSAVHVALQLANEGEIPAPDRLDAIARSFGLDESGRLTLESAACVYLGSQIAAELGELDVVRREWPFAVRIGDADVAFDLAGSLDAYGRSGASGLVVDYKTGGALSDEGLVERYRLQASCYGLAALRDGCETVRVVFIRPQVLDDAGEPQVVEFFFSRKDVGVVEAELRALHARMRIGEYAALKRWESTVCEECPIARTVCRVPGPPLRRQG